MNYNWNWRIFFELSADQQHTWLMTLVQGLGWTLATSFCALIIALVVGSAIGIIRTTPNRWAVLFGNAYVELFRNIPLLVQLFLWYFVLPEVLPKAPRRRDQAHASTMGIFCARRDRYWACSPRHASRSRCGPVPGATPGAR